MARKIGAEAFIFSKVEDIEKAKKLILPRVGSFDNGMKNVFERGLFPILNPNQQDKPNKLKNKLHLNQRPLFSQKEYRMSPKF